MLTPRPTIDDLLRAGTTTLSGRSDSARLDAELLLAHALGRTREYLYMHASQPVPGVAVHQFEAALAERARHRPVAQLTGEREFWSLRLRITEDTLVPRPETELLVERALARLPADRALDVLDLGTGSGAISLALASERPGLRILAIDRSAAALAVARENAERCAPRAALRFAQGDWYAATGAERFDLIVANPPYVADGEWDASDPELRFEPAAALRAGPDGLDALRVIAAGAPAHLRPGGWLIVEHGRTQGAAVAALLADAGLRQVAAYRDLAGHARVTEAQRAAT